MYVCVYVPAEIYCNVSGKADVSSLDWPNLFFFLNQLLVFQSNRSTNLKLPGFSARTQLFTVFATIDYNKDCLQIYEIHLLHFVHDCVCL